MTGLSTMGYAPGGDALFRRGLVIPVHLAAPDSDTWIKCSAEIDTGAAGSAVSPGLFRRLGVASRKDAAVVHEANKPTTSMSACRAQIQFPDGVRLLRRFLILKSLGGEIDVLFGRDLLRNGKLVVDFVQGHFTLLMDWDLLGKE